jgi:hypothetical protein
MMQTLVGDLVIHEVHHPAKTQKKILEILREQGIAADTYATAANSGEEIYDQEDQAEAE